MEREREREGEREREREGGGIECTSSRNVNSLGYTGKHHKIGKSPKKSNPPVSLSPSFQFHVSGS